MTKIRKLFTKLIKNWRFLIFFIFLACLIVFILIKLGLLGFNYSFQYSKANGKKNGAERSEFVKTAKVELRDQIEALETVGTLKPEYFSVVRPRVEGLIRTLHFQEGQWVKAGQLLAQLDSESFQYALQVAQSQLEREQAALVSAKHELQRLKKMADAQAVSAQQLDQQVALVSQLNATVQAQSAVRDQARLNLSYTKVRAPVSGQIGLRQVDIGNLVRPTDINGLASIVQTNNFWVDFAIAQRFWPRIQGSMQLSKANQFNFLQVEILDRSTREIITKGSVVAKDNIIDSATGTIRFKAKLQGNFNNWLPNQLLGVRLILQTHSQLLTVPIQAVQFGQSGTYVWVLSENRQVRRVAVQTGIQDKGYIAITGDLKSNDNVVVVGTDRLREGQKVRIAQPLALLSVDEKKLT